MLDRNQKTRIGFDEILAHPVFAHLDWNQVANLEYTGEIMITALWSIDAVMLILVFFSNMEFPRGGTLQATKTRR